MAGSGRPRQVRTDGYRTNAAPAAPADAHARSRRGRLRPWRVHDLGRGRAGGHASADAAHVRVARADRAQALAQGHATVFACRRRAAPAHTGDDGRAGPEPRGGGTGIRAGDDARGNVTQGAGAGAPGDRAEGRGRAPGGAAPRAAGGDSSLHPRWRADPRIRLLVRLARRCAALAAAATLALPGGAVAHGGHAGAAPAGAAPAPARLQLVLPLATDLRGLTRFADAVSTPGSPSYGDYASVAWLARRFGARPAVRRRVVAYLRGHGARAVSVDATDQLVRARMGVAAAARMFHTSLARVPGARAARSLSPSSPAVLPRPLRGLVTGVVGLDTAPLRPQAAAASSGYRGPDPGATPSGCAGGVRQGGFTPNEYLDAYHYAPLQQQGLLGQGERVALIEIDGFLTSDLKAFATCFHLHVPSVRAIPVGVAGP